MPKPNRAEIRSIFKLIYNLFIGVICLSVISCSREAETGLNPGDLPPQFELESISGHAEKLSDYRGKVILLNFWASWCAPCVEELPALQNLYDKLKDRGFVVIGVGIDDTKASLEEFKRRFGLTFPLLIDLDGKVKNNYRVSGVPESFVIGSDGRLVMLSDPSGNLPVLRFIGPRDWDAPNSISRFEKLLTVLKQ